ncbi:LacI family DNA-binding transcriptional regulator [Bifidobacterium goeldii]|nr:LacI family DNA-binding transcriptional regulator [Bifidobacterium goeldii]
MNTPGKKATIRDVARLAGVSYGTVSRYLNGSAHVSGDAAQRIAAAIKEAQYTPNNAARSLAQRRTLTVALIIQVESRETIVQSSVSSAMAGANQVLGDAGYQMVTVIANSEASTQRIAQLVQSDFADGYLLFSLSNDTSLEQTFLDTQRPVVGSEINESNQVKFPTVDFTNEEGQRSITQYLLNRGRTELLYVCGPGYSPSSLNRLRGFRAALGEQYHDENVYYADDWEITSGEMAVIAFQSKLDTADGIICANDNIAVGVINQLNRLGYRVPEDIAVTGFDDSPMAMLANPKLTTVRQDSELHGMTMAKLLLEMMSGKSVDRRHTVMLPTSIIKRQSA